MKCKIRLAQIKRRYIIRLKVKYHEFAERVMEHEKR